MINIEKPKIGIIGYFGHQNAGDEAMREILQAEFPGSVASSMGKIEKCDAYIIAGGDLVQEFDGLYMPELWQSVTDEPCYALSMGVKPGWVKFQSDVIASLKKFRKIYMRDQKSVNILSEFVKVEGVMPDLVLSADAPREEEHYPVLFNYTDRPWVTPDDQFKDVIDQGNILPVALCPEFDLKYAKLLVDYKKFISMAKASKGVIGTRLHAVVFGVISQVPVAGIAYEEKVKKFCERYQIPCFEYGVKNGEKIISSIKKATIDLAKERGKIREVIKLIKSDLADVWGVK